MVFGLGGGKKSGEDEWAYDELPSPANTEEMLALLETEKQVRINWMNGTADDGWKDYATIDGIHIEVMAVPNSSINVVRAKGVLKNINLQAIFDAYLSGGMEERKKVNSDIYEHEMCWQHPENQECYITYDSFKAPMGVATREFVCLRNKEINQDGSHFIVVQSVNWKDKPFGRGHVRGIMRSGRLFEPLEGSDVRLTIVDHVEPRGNIPSFVVNMFTKKAAEIYTKMEKVYGNK